MAAAGIAIAGGLALAIVMRVYRLWRAGIRERQPLLMNRVLQHEGVSLEGRTDQNTLAQVAHAARGCLLCRDQDTCRAWLEGESSRSLPEFCPNAELINRLKTEPPAAR